MTPLLPVNTIRRRGSVGVRGAAQGGRRATAGRRTGRPGGWAGSFRPCRHPCGFVAATKRANFRFPEPRFRFHIRGCDLR